MTNAVEQITNPVSPINGLDVVNAVNGFYSSAFVHTCWLLGILITILGIAVPTAYYLLQNRQLKLKERSIEDNLVKSIESKVTAARKSLSEENTKSLAQEMQKVMQKFGDLDQQTNRKLNFAVAGILQVQGNILSEKNEHFESVKSYLSAVKTFSIATAVESVRSNLLMATEQLSGVNKQDFEDGSLTKLANEAIEQIAELDEVLLNDDVKKFKESLSEASNRATVKK